VRRVRAVWAMRTLHIGAAHTAAISNPARASRSGTTQMRRTSVDDTCEWVVIAVDAVKG
jgi:hypothetical protein